MDPQAILRHLRRDIAVRCFDTLDSTNQYAKQWAREGAPFGAAVLAEQQTAGRGRRGRSFYSPKGGLYLSLILPPRQQPGQLTTLAAVAVRWAVQEVAGRSLDIKWVNDLLLDGRKVCGILVEGIAGERGLTHAVLGIGVNTADTAFPPELAGSAAALPPLDRDRLAAAVIREVLDGLPRIPGHMAEYRAHCLTLGQAVRFEWEGQQHEGTARAVEDDGALRIGTADGELLLLAGEASIRLQDGRYA